jgi:hypothetical protein|tara:strand:- start:1097 stop:1393 length:297 start_codon:yes stop_codon:yes gene_type:complete
MNNKKAKQIKKQVRFILVEWLQSLLPEEEGKKINTSNVLKYIPKDMYYSVAATRYLSAYHPKWISNKIKKLLKVFPDLSVKSINLESIQWIQKSGTPQ